MSESTRAPLTETTDEPIDTDYRGQNIVLEPMPPGLWTILLGAGLAVLGPAAGFLIGSILGVGDDQSVVNPVYVSLVIGLVLGGIGGLIALLGTLRFIRRRARRSPPQD